MSSYLLSGISWFKSQNYNVKLNIIFVLLSSTGRSVWQTNVLSLLIVALVEATGSKPGLKPNEMVGISSALSGFATLLAVLPAGFLSDFYGKQRIIRIATCIGICSLGFVIFSIQFKILFIGLILWGFYEGFSKPAVDSLVADSMPSGKRSSILCIIHAVEQFAFALGPCINVMLFLILGDSWDISILKRVLIFGCMLSFCSLMALFLFKDKKSIGIESEALIARTPQKDTSLHLKTSKKKLTAVFKQHSSVPVILLLSNIIIGCGAGMTVKFFPIFYKMIYHLKPSTIQIILGVTAISTGLLSILVQRISIKKGRIEMIIFVQIVATLCLVTFIVYPPLVLMIPLFIIRGSFMNTTMPLSSSILMDFIQKKDRGKWSSLNTIAWGLFWNGSALIGGFLIGKDNFKLSFTTTAIVYCIGIIPLFSIIKKVSREKHHTEQECAFDQSIVGQE